MNVCISESIMEKEDEKLLLVILIGIFEALKSNNLSIREAERFLFSPYIFNKLKAKKCSSKIINIIERGCELENIKSLIPEHLSNAIEELIMMTIATINEYPQFETNRWIQVYDKLGRMETL